MKKRIIGIGLMGVFVMGTFLANAQTGNPNWIVSKDVQRVANKKNFEDIDLRKSHVQARSVEFPSIVVSKGVFRKTNVQTQVNIESKGTPSWVNTKGVNRISKR